MLGRFVAERFETSPCNFVSDEVVSSLMQADIRIANLESPVTNIKTDDSLRFAANEQLLKQFTWLDCFSLSNNHINDFGIQGMKDTIRALDNIGINYNGLYYNKYMPLIIDDKGERIAVITCTDMMNYEFEKTCPYKTNRVNKPDEIIACIRGYKTTGYFVIVYAHVGMLFTRYPNPVIKDFVHKMIDEGADCVVTVHPHCLGGSEVYKDRLIIYSLGDFLMDGASYRRRQSGVLNLTINNGIISEWSILPIITDNNLIVRLPDKKISNKMQGAFRKVSSNLKKHSNDYLSFYKKQYKIELIQHALSTLRFEYDRRGPVGLFKLLSKRSRAVSGMTKRVFTDRTSMSYDVDAVSEKNISINDIR